MNETLKQLEDFLQKKGLQEGDYKHLITSLQGQLKNKKYGLLWEDNEPEKVYKQLIGKFPLLHNIEKRNIVTDKDDPTHCLIEGDNIHALKNLQTTHKNKINAIYIDPPYNTGNQDFIYNDKFVDKEDSWKHSKWISFMEKRLQLARPLLVDNGVIFISIDEYEYAQLKILCDEVFGEDNFIANIVWDKRNPKGNTKTISSVTEYILCYAKNKNNITEMNVKKENAQRIINKANSIFKNKKLDLNQKNKELQQWLNLQPFLAGEKAYRFIDKSGEVYRPVSLAAPTNSKNKYKVIHPKTKKSCKLPKNGLRIKKAVFDELLDSERILFGKDESTIPNRKYFLKENMSMTLTDLISYAGNGITDLTRLGFDRNAFNNPKPIYLIKRLLEFLPNDTTILDFFAGSGTTGHAVLELNQEDGGKRQFILCTNNENNICKDVTHKRIKRVIEGYTTPKGDVVEGIGNNLYYYKVKLHNDLRDLDENIEALLPYATDMIAVKENCFHKSFMSNDYDILENKNKVIVICKDDVAMEGELNQLTKIIGSYPQEEKIIYTTFNTYSSDGVTVKPLLAEDLKPLETK